MGLVQSRWLNESLPTKASEGFLWGFYFVMSDVVLERLLGVAEETAVSAAALLREKWEQPRQLTAKGFRDLVTDADFASQKLITGHIQQTFPDHGFLTEEEAGDLPSSGSIIWVIDPVDGTTNYSRQIPIFTVAIAAVDTQANEVVVGVILDPMRQELFSAAKGQGAWLRVGEREKRPLTTSTVPTLAESIISLDMSHDRQTRQSSIEFVQQFGNEVSKLRLIGSAALSLAWLAAGRIDAYLNYRLQPWDVAAAGLLVQEAGGVLTAPNGQPWHWAARASGVLATNGRLHPQFLQLLNSPR